MTARTNTVGSGGLFGSGGTKFTLIAKLAEFTPEGRKKVTQSGLGTPALVWIPSRKFVNPEGVLNENAVRL
jgi:hypothetical protein